jgi:hypothetical protein
MICKHKGKVMFRSSIKLISLLFIGLLSVSLQSQTAVAPAAGDGSEANPCQIATLQNLYWIAADSSHWKYHYVQIADINAAETKNWFGGSGWLPIGLNGTYNGKGHHIDSLYINRGFMVGLFGDVYGDGVRIDSLGLTSVNIVGETLVGGLAAANDGIISNCFCTGTITCPDNPSSIMVGGLVGENYKTISNCYSACTITGHDRVGGLVGGNKGIISSCFTTNTVGGSENIGGLVGCNYSGTTVSDCYSTSSVNCTSQYAGGLIGFNDGEIKNCYSSGAVNGAKYMGGLIGYNYGKVNNSFWDTQRSGLDTSASGTGKTTAEMKVATTFTNAGWDFIDEIANGIADNWGINKKDNSGYPFLKWQGFINEHILSSTIAKVPTVPNITLKREGMLLFSTTGTINLVNLNGKVVCKSRVLNGNHYMSLAELRQGIFIARSGTESLRIVNAR